MDVKKAVRDTYGKVARRSSCCCGAGGAEKTGSAKRGYASGDLTSVPFGADMGLGCGNPTALADLQPGEAVLDLGCGGGLDCFLAAKAVGPSGRVIGVDMTPEMVERARASAAAGGYANVEFRLGEIEALPVEDGSVDALMSNCVINLVPDKARAFGEAYRVLRPGGRMHVSDIVLEGQLPEAVRESVEAYVGCVAGAATRSEYVGAIEGAGFTDITIEKEQDALELFSEACCSDPIAAAAVEACCSGGVEIPKGLVKSITLSARKP